MISEKMKPFDIAPVALSFDDNQPPDLLITTHVAPHSPWCEATILDTILPIIAHGYQLLKNNYPYLKQSEISLLLSDNATIRKLNRKWRTQDCATNVLAFAQFSPEELFLSKQFPSPQELGVQEHNSHHLDNNILIDSINPPLKKPLGDIVIAYETSFCEATEQQISFEYHIAHLFVHGFLHLLGLDHETLSDTEAMQTLEITILAQCAIPNPYLKT